MHDDARIESFRHATAKHVFLRAVFALMVLMEFRSAPQ
jgi:hypothetical protein